MVTDDFKIESDGGDKLFIDKMQLIKNAIPNVVSKILAEAAEKFISNIQSFLVYGRGRRTGEYAESWGITEISEKSVTVATPKGKLMLWLEYGTAPHPITPKDAKVLAFQVGSETVFAMYVRHPGTPPIPHFRPAVELLKIQLPQIVERNIKEIFNTS